MRAYGTRPRPRQGRRQATGPDQDALIRYEPDQRFAGQQIRTDIFLCEQCGLVPDQQGHGLGLYFDDTRFLRAYSFWLCDQELDVLASSDRQGDRITHLLTNPDLRDADGKLISKEGISVTLRRALSGERLELDDEFRFQNYALEKVKLPFDIDIKADFSSVFDVRGMLGMRPGDFEGPESNGDGLNYTYRGGDSRPRKLDVQFEPRPQSIDGSRARFLLEMQERATMTIRVKVRIEEIPGQNEGPSVTQDSRNTSGGNETYLRNRTEVRVADEKTQQVFDASFRDLRMLQTRIDGETFFAAGIPWFVTIFGRDSLLTALQTLGYNPQIAEQTLLLMAKYQGRNENQWTEEQPGKIPHELRRDELTNIGEIPYTPYYGTVDATPLFLLLLARHAQWTGRLDVFEKLESNVRAALAWLDDSGDSDGDGYLDYAVKTHAGLINQGWKDSSDAMVGADGSLAEPPIAPAEVQGYVYAARREVADIFELAGDSNMAVRLRQESEDLKKRFNRDFWSQDLGCYAMALEKGMRPLSVASSNAGQVLWSGIADEDKAQKQADRLMQKDMFSGWGIRTLSSNEKRYSPNSYHLGSVWPHDNSIIFGGLRRHGHDTGLRIFQAMIDAAVLFDNSRLPELFCGFERDLFLQPVRYPVACHPQAWATGSVPYMLQEALGLKPLGFENRLLVGRPRLPPAIPEVELDHLRLGDSQCHLRFIREPDGRAKLEIVNASSGLRVELQDDEA